MEHELRAKQLHTEAARLEVHLHAELEKHKVRFEIAEAKQKTHKMLEEAEHLEQQGHIDEARRLRFHAEDMAEKLHARMVEAEEKDLEQMDREIAKLRAASEKAEREGQIDEAERLI